MSRRVVLVVGAPGSGKSTFARSLDVDGVLEREQFGDDEAFREAVTAWCGLPDARVVVVRTAATLAEQDEWRVLAGASEVVVMSTDAHTCRQRVADRRRPGWRGEMMAVKRWFAEREPA